MATSIEKLVKQIVADGNGSFDGFLKLPITEQQKVVELFEEVHVYRKHYLSTKTK